MKETKTMKETGSAVATRKRVRDDDRKGRKAVRGPSSPPPASAPVPQDESRLLLEALTSLKHGDSSVRLPIDWSGMQGKIAETFNEVVELNERMAEELARLRQKVGKEGKLKQRAEMSDVRGFWRAQIHCVNALIDDLVHPTSETARVIGAVA
ncbi:MAG TPA: hypothetical protein VM122_04715, partial [Usitatibacter sp.]|nr:hypothetical protein [Usitatibacter sp.]